MTPQELKNSILQLAIQGKLVEQRPEESTAEELFAKIQEEKQRLVSEKKIKKEKPLPEITDDEKPFEIPESWMWVRVQEITCLNPKNDLPDELETSFIPMALVDDGYRNNHSFEIKTWGDIKKGFTHFANGDIGIAKITPCFQNRKSVVFRNLKNGYGAGTTELSVVRVVNDLLSRDFLLWFFKSAYFIENGVKSFTGTAGQQRIHKDYLATCVFPLPPLTEQKRIVAKIEELLPLVDRYEQAWSKLEQFNSRFPKDMKKSLLQYAIQGKLAEQRPEEGTAEELFARIQEEKQRLIAEKKIKKEKPLPEITDDEKPFDIPESWKWVKLGEIVTVLGGKRIPAGRQLTTENTGYKYIRVSDMKDGTVLTEGLLYVPSDIFPSIARYIIHKDDVYITVAGTIGRVGKIPEEIDGANLTENADRLIFSMLEQNWLIKCLESNVVQSQIVNVTTKVGQPKLAIKRIQELIIPLPPLAEQKRIVEKLEQLLPLCERLK